VSLWDPIGLYSWEDFGYDAASVILTAADIALGGPTGEGIVPAMAMQAAKQAAKESAKNAGKGFCKKAAKEAAKDRFRELTEGKPLKRLEERNTKKTIGVGTDEKGGVKYQPKPDGSYSVGPPGDVRHYRPTPDGGYSVNQR
jgi:hypothetical protein